jgi:hypothetical protein
VERITLEGQIAGVGFASGDRFVVGMWERGPLGPMTDVMWARPDGTRILLAPTDEVANFVGGIYDFEEVRTVAIEACRWADGFRLSAGTLRLEVHGGTPYRIFALRPRRLRRSLVWVRLEDFVLRRMVGTLLLGGRRGVRVCGRTRTGIKEWYRIDGYRTVVDARGRLDGRDLGPLHAPTPPMGFGFSEFPGRPAIVACSPVLEGATLPGALSDSPTSGVAAHRPKGPNAPKG